MLCDAVLRSSTDYIVATFGSSPIGWSTSGGYTSGRCVRCSSCRRGRVRTPCAARRGTCWRRTMRRTCSRCRSRPAPRRRPRTCSDAILRRRRRRKSMQHHSRRRRARLQRAHKWLVCPDICARSVKYVQHVIMYLMLCCYKMESCAAVCEVVILIRI